MSRLIRAVLVLWGILRGVARAPRDAVEGSHPGPREPDWAPDSADADADPTRLETGAPRWAELLLAGLLVGAGLLLAAFAVLIVVYPDTQLLGGMAGGGLALLAVALIVAGNSVVPQETAVEERPTLVDRDEQRAFRQDVASGVEGISRRKLIAGAAGVAGTGLAAAAALPVTALGPGPKVLNESPWRASLALVDEEGKPISADDLVDGSFITAFPEGADKRELASPVVVVRIPPETLELPPERRDWAPEGIMAYSKVCTHASCAVSLFKYPLYPPQSSGPALVCPCHYSTFDVRQAAKVVFGPAGRPLPQLPLRIGLDRTLVAAGPLSGSIGPAWLNTDRSES
jgi:ubiquinol-cytochrome c reductase iron-sulfur subunit